VKAYPVEKFADEANWISEDELDLDLAQNLQLRYGSV
jgi:hypothetical protein